MMTPADLEALDRLEQKVKLLIATIGRLQNERDRLNEDTRRLSGELEETRARLSEAEGSAAEIVALREEREQVRTRVSGMLEQLEGLNL
ncbi:MAG: cell division protein ZapB [Acidobacteria bacterium]|nr:MAG: cell division protein ZapB [Acidobacteriota bacterium]